MIYIIDAILAIKPNIGVTVRNEDIDNIVWDDANDIISKEDILAKKSELETAYANAEYQRKRAVEYPTWQDQMDMQYKDLLNGTTTWKDAVAKVKSDNPKE